MTNKIKQVIKIIIEYILALFLMNYIIKRIDICFDLSSKYNVFKNTLYSLVLLLIVNLYIKNLKLTRDKTKFDNKGIGFKEEDGTFGTANWMNEKEILESFELETKQGIIIGKYNDKIVTLPPNTNRNKNVAIFGASGSRKSRRICYTKYH